MSNERNPHPSREQLAAFDAGHLAPVEREAIERHVADCPLCERELGKLPEIPFVALVRASVAPRGVHSADTPEPLLSSVPDALSRHPRYRILEVLGAGGMGVVYKAVHRVMDRVVALKVLHRRFTEHPDFVERFRQEVRAIARLTHPHIALAYDAEQAGDLHFLVMEYVPGMSLDRVAAQRGPLPVVEACDYVRQAALGLQHAFEQGLVHRDVKPQNLMRTPGGQIKVLDFGLVHLGRESGEETTILTGAFAGTPDYAAPEQARHPHSADIRADVYGLGCTLWFLLTGQPLFPSGSTLQKLLAHQDRPPRPIPEFRGDVPASLLVLLDRMLAKEPAQRPATPGETARALAPFAGVAEEPSEIPITLPTRRRRLFWLSLVAALLVVAGGILIFVCVRPRQQPPIAEMPPPVAESVAPALADPLVLATPEQLVRLRNERRDQALDWLRDNNRLGVKAPLVRDTAVQFDIYPGQIDGFQILLGSRWLRSRQAVLLAGNLGGFFVYPLSAEQARALGIKEGTRLIRSSRNLADRRRAVPRVALSALTFESGSQVDLNKKIPGSVAYEVRGPAITGAFAVRLTVSLDGGQRRVVLQWFTGRTLEGSGKLRFLCPPLGSRNFQPRGPIVVFADLCTDVEASMVVESDATARLIEAIPPKKPAAP